MALTGPLMTAVGAAAQNDKVQQGALSLLNGVYGKLLGRPDKDGTSAKPLGSEELGQLLAGLATREEVGASFALLQAELDRRHRHTATLVIASLVVQAVILAAVLLLR